MKIVHVCLSGVYTEGWSYQENLLSKYHAMLGYDVTLITNKLMYDDAGNKVEAKDTDYINSNHVRIIRLEEKFGKPLRKFQRYPDFYQTIEAEAPDIIFIHSCQFLDTDKIVQYKTIHPNTKLYVDNHADFSNSASGWLSQNILHKIIWKSSAKRLLPLTEMFYGVMPSRVDFLEKIYGLPKEKIELLVMGADDEKIEAALKPEVRKYIRNQYGIAEEDFLIITGGKIDLAKKQTLLLMRAVNDLNIPNVKLLVFGSVVDELKDEVKELCSPVVQYIGWVDSKITDQYFAAADLVVFPGRHSVFWEQVAGMGIPMVCKFWDGTTHVDVGGNVRFIQKDSVEEITRILRDIVETEGVYARMKEVAQEEGRKIFSYREIAKRSIGVPTNRQEL